MLTDRQLADIQADVAAVLGSERGVSPNERLLARHCRYLLDEVERLKGQDTPTDWIDPRNDHEHPEP